MRARGLLLNMSGGSPEKGIRNASQIASQKIREQSISTNSRRERIGSLFRQIMGTTAAFSSTVNASNDSLTTSGNDMVETSAGDGVEIINEPHVTQESQHLSQDSTQEIAETRYFVVRREESAEANKANFDWVGKLVRDVEVDIIYKIVGVVYMGSKRRKDEQLFKYHKAAMSDPSDNDMEYTYCSEISQHPESWELIMDVDQAVRRLTDKYNSNTKLIDISVEDIGIFGLLSPSIIYIPKLMVSKVRSVFNRYLKELLDDITSVEKWKKWYLIGIILFNGTKVQSMNNYINETANKLLEDRWDFRLATLSTLSGKKRMHESDSERTSEWAQKLISMGELSRAARSLIADKRSIPKSKETAEELRKLHFGTREASTPSNEELARMWSYPSVNDPNGLILTISGKMIEENLRKMGKLVSPGLDQIRAEHVKLLWGVWETDPDPQTLQFRDLYTRLANSYMAGRVPAAARSLAYDKKLVALAKPGKPLDDIRPISLIPFHRKLFGKCADNTTNDFNKDYFGDLQCASKAGGIEEIIHAISLSLQYKKSNSVWLPDAEKGYPRLARHRAIAREIMAHFPQIVPFLRSVYGTDSHSWYNVLAENEDYEYETFKFKSEEGVDQGCPNAKWIYTMGIHPLVKEVNSILGEDEFVKFFVDDGNVAASFETLVNVIDIFDSVGNSVGYFRSRTKGTFLLGSCNGDREEVDRRIAILVAKGIPKDSIKIHPDDAPDLINDFGAMACGGIIGSDEYIKKRLEEKLLQLEKEAEVLQTYGKKQGLHLLLKYSFSQKINHLQRTTRPDLILTFVERFDDMRRKLFDKILGEEVNDMTWKIICSSKGLGYVDVKNATYPAFVASICEAKDGLQKVLPNIFSNTQLPTLQYFYQSVAFLNNRIEKEEDKLRVRDLYKSVADAREKKMSRKLQHFISERIEKDISDDIYTVMATYYDHFETRNTFHHHIRWLKTASTDTANIWLSAMPRTKTHTFSNEEFESVVRLHLFLGQRVLVNGGKCEVGSHVCDNRGHHLLWCPKGGGVIRRHDHVVNIVETMTRLAGIKCSQNVNRIFQTRLPNERKKPDLFISGGQGLRDIVADVRICLPTHINDAISRQEAEENYKRHATEAFNNKINKHGAAAETNDYDLLPMIMTTTGLLHDRFKDYITRTVKRMAPDNTYLQAIHLRYWFTLLSCAIQKCNVRIILDRSRIINGSLDSIGRNTEYNKDYYMDQTRNAW